jgi:hypothetical protein
LAKDLKDIYFTPITDEELQTTVQQKGKNFVSLSDIDKVCRICPYGQDLNKPIMNFWNYWLTRFDSCHRNTDYYIASPNLYNIIKNKDFNFKDLDDLLPKNVVMKDIIMITVFNCIFQWELCVIFNAFLSKLTVEDDDALKSVTNDNKESKEMYNTTNNKSHEKIPTSRNGDSVDEDSVDAKMEDYVIQHNSNVTMNINATDGDDNIGHHDETTTKTCNHNEANNDIHSSVQQHDDMDSTKISSVIATASSSNSITSHDKDENNTDNEAFTTCNVENNTSANINHDADVENGISMTTTKTCNHNEDNNDTHSSLQQHDDMNPIMPSPVIDRASSSNSITCHEKDDHNTDNEAVTTCNVENNTSGNVNHYTDLEDGISMSRNTFESCTNDVSTDDNSTQTVGEHVTSNISNHNGEKKNGNGNDEATSHSTRSSSHSVVVHNDDGNCSTGSCHQDDVEENDATSKSLTTEDNEYGDEAENECMSNVDVDEPRQCELILFHSKSIDIDNNEYSKCSIIPLEEAKKNKM